MFANVGDDGSLWGPIIEKAFAKFHGNYARLDYGDATHGISTLNGSPHKKIETSDESINSLWAKLLQNDSESALMTAATKNGNGYNNNNLKLNHAYTILSLV